MELNVVVAVCSALIGMLFTYLTFMRNRDKDVHARATETAVISTKLDTINTGVENIRIEQKVEQRERMELAERVTRVEESSKSAHLRINKMEDTINEN